MFNRNALVFLGPGEVKIIEESLAEPGPGQVLVRTLLSAISPGTETLIYNGQFPSELSIDEGIPSLAGAFTYPFKYGYAAVGKVEQCGPGVDQVWDGRLVFAFEPHQTHFLIATDYLLPIPADCPLERAAFLPSMETAVSFVMDGAPLIGENVAIFGQGVVGLLVTALLARFPLEYLVTFDLFPMRRRVAREMGASTSLTPGGPDITQVLAEILPDGADLTYELSGSPQALDLAIAATGFAGRVVIGSWYGQKRANVDLGGRFHRSRIQLLSSQVTTLAPQHSGRWTKGRRFEVAWELLRRVQPEKLITHRFSLEHAQEAYQLISTSPESSLQVVFTY